MRARGAERRRGVQGAREWGRQCLLWPPLDGKVIRVLGTPRGRMVMAVVEEMVMVVTVVEMVVEMVWWRWWWWWWSWWWWWWRW